MEEGGEPLYSKIQKVFLKTHNSEEGQRDVRVTVDLASAFSKVSKQVLRVQVTDDDDPFFLHSLLITEDDYQRLKVAQGLLVDFHNFPAQVVRLLEQCNEEGAGQKFLLFLEEEVRGALPDTRSSLKIVEANNFKHLCHLVLNLEPGNDSDIKKLMLKKIKRLKDQTSKDTKAIQQLEAQLQSQTQLLESKQQELLRIQKEWNEEKIMFKTESSKELTEETEKLKKSQMEWKIQMQRDFSDMEEKYKTTLKEKEADISRLLIENKVLLEKYTHSETILKEQSKRIENTENDLTSVKWELSTVRKQTSKLDSDYHEKEKALNSLKTKFAVCEQELKDKCVLLNKQQELLTVATEQKNRVEEVLLEKDKNLQRKQLSLQNVSDELVKANEIITKLQKELSVVTTKLKVRTSIALEQEKVVESGQKKIEKLEKQLLDKEKKIHALIGSELLLKKSLGEIEKKVESREKTISDNERTIEWLNKRIGEMCMESTPKWNSNFVNGTSPASSTPFSRVQIPENGLPETLKDPKPVEEPIDINKFDHMIRPTPPRKEEPAKTITPEPPKSQNFSAKTPSLKSNNSKSKHPIVGFKRLNKSEVDGVASSYFLR
jgi:spindle assembly abnormal protein 6